MSRPETFGMALVGLGLCYHACYAPYLFQLLDLPVNRPTVYYHYPFVSVVTKRRRSVSSLQKVVL